jgi:branched-chain amino acid transport system permease protein
MAVLQAIIDGLLIGGVYSVISVGLTLVFGVMGIVNFAQAEFMMVGMLVAYFVWVLLGIDPIIGALISFGFVYLMSTAVYTLLISRVLSAPHTAQILLTVGLLIVIENAALLMFGPDFRSVRTPYQDFAFKLGGIFVSAPYLVAFLLAGASAVSLWLVLQRSWIGRAMRATAQNSMAARIVGIDVDRIYCIAFGLGTGLTAFGGAIVLSYITVSPSIGAQFVVLMFTVVVLGGLGNVLGALVGGLLTGVIQSLSALFLPIQMQNLVLFVVFIMILALKPEGILGRSQS